MKNNLWVMSLLMIMCLPQRSIYSIKIKPVGGGEPISMSSYANMKILVTTVQADRPDIPFLQQLDSLQAAETALKIIVVPTIDLDKEGNDSTIAALKNSLSLDFIITRSAHVKKKAGGVQHPLFRWLTDLTENGHFDRDAEATGQYFIISKKGILYSVLGKDVPPAVLRQVIRQEF